MSSLAGPTILGKRRRRASMQSRVSSTESVVWVRYATLSGSATASLSTSSGCAIRNIRSGASPMVPTTSSWSAWPTRMIE